MKSDEVKFNREFQVDVWKSLAINIPYFLFFGLLIFFFASFFNYINIINDAWAKFVLLIVLCFVGIKLVAIFGSPDIRLEYKRRSK